MCRVSREFAYPPGGPRRRETILGLATTHRGVLLALGRAAARRSLLDGGGASPRRLGGSVVFSLSDTPAPERGSGGRGAGILGYVRCHAGAGLAHGKCTPLGGVRRNNAQRNVRQPGKISGSGRSDY